MTFARLLKSAIVPGLLLMVALPSLVDHGARAQVPGSPVALQSADPRQALESARGEERGILDQLNALDQDLQSVREERDGLSERFEALETQRRVQEDAVASAEAVAETYRGSVAVRLSALYKVKRRGLARLVFGADDPTDLRRRAFYIYRILVADRTKLHTFAAARKASRDAMAELDRNATALKALRIELQLKESEIKEQKSRRLALLDEIKTKKGSALRALSEEARTQTAFTAFARGATGGAVVPEGASSFRSAYGRLPCPTTGRLLHKMGTYRDAITGQQRESSGIDLTADYGTPFRAVFSGQVLKVDFLPGYGQTVMVQHGPYVSVYAHANGVRVRSGQWVEAGDQLGSVGNSGLTDTDGYMLTFEIRYEGQPQDPLLWLATSACK